MSERVDVVVLGLGPGGEEVAGQLAESGLRVVGVDGGLVGGECPYWGCVPSKMMIRAANLLAEARRIPGMAGASAVTPDWGPVARRIRDEATDDWNDHVAVERLERRGARLVRGWGRLDGRGRVVVGDDVFEATTGVVVASGAAAWAPPVPGLAETPYWTNRQAIEADPLPASLAILGGGAIGLELGQVYARFGCEVVVVEVAERILSLEEPEASDLLRTALEEDGVGIVESVQVERVDHTGDMFTLALSGREDVRAERLLVATGRRPDLRAIGVASVGLDDGAKAIATDGRMRAAPGVWAIGDVTGVGAFTHVAMYQAAICVDDVLGRAVVEADYHALPRVTFTDPEVGAVGRTEHVARQAGTTVRTGFTQLPTSTRGWIHKAGNAGFIKVVEDAERGVLVGATSAGPVGGEVLGFLALAVQCAIPTEAMRHMIYAYPTFHRAIEAALDDLRSHATG